MKRLLQGLLIGSICVVGSNADYKLVLTDKDGVQTEQCIKSYSFSNNLESIAKQKGIGQDVYSEEETLTNKVWMGKPVYRKVFKIDDFIVPNNDVTTERWTPVISNEIEDIVDISFKGYANSESISNSNSHHIHYSTYSKSFIRVNYHTVSKKVGIFLRQVPSNSSWNISTLTITAEYTKTSDGMQSIQNEFSSYLHYIPSSSTTDEVVTKNMDELGVQFLKNYTFDGTTDSCTKN